MNREETIKGVKGCVGMYYGIRCGECPYGPYSSDCVESLHRDVERMLKAQEPVEPVVDIDIWKCGKCGHTLEHQELLGDNVLFHEQYNYCPNCGQAVKWDA